MAEVITPRLLAAAKEFNIGTQTLTDFLTSKGFDADELKPTSKITGDMYLALQVEFQPDKVAKQKAEQIDLPKNAPPDNKKRRDEQDLSFTKKEPLRSAPWAVQFSTNSVIDDSISATSSSENFRLDW